MSTAKLLIHGKLRQTFARISWVWLTLYNANCGSRYR